MKEKQDVISDFNELVNMTASELESWLKSDDSNSAGWPKSGGDGDGESVGHESGRKIVEILKSNPKKDSEKYTDDQVEHMRKVVAYCKRHLAQETAGNNDKSEEEVKKTKSYASLKNWGHDFLKAQGKGVDKESDTPKSSKRKDEAAEEGEDDVEEANEEDEENVGSKRKQADDQEVPSKKRETHKGESKKSSKEDDSEEADEEENGDDAGKKTNGQANGESKEPRNGPSKGDTVSWNWGSGQPEGKVVDVKEEKTSITTKRGNEVSKNGTAEDPAVVLDTGKSEAVKLAHELN